MWQTIIIAGYLGRDPELRYLNDGTAVCNMSVGVNIGYGDNEQRQWWRVSAWGKSAEACNQYLSKGDPVLVQGTVKGDPETGGPSIFSRHDGTVGASFEMNANSVKFLPKRDGGGQRSGRRNSGGARQHPLLDEDGAQDDEPVADQRGDTIPW